MAFPITVNGRTWALADFQNGEYAANLGPFLYDCLTALAARLESTSTTSLSIGTGSKTFTVASGLLFKVGQQVRASVASDPKVFMAGTVTSYSGTTLIVSMVTYYGTGTYASWNISAAGLSLVNSSSPLDADYGGSAVVLAELLRAYTTFGLPDVAMETIFEDFTGYFPTITTSTSDSVQRAFKGVMTGSARITNDGNIATIVRESDRVTGILDGAHPGIAVLEVTAAGDVADLRYGPAAFACMREGAVVQIKFYWPRSDSSSDTTNLSLGLRSWDGDSRSTGFAIHYPSVVSTDDLYLGLDVTPGSYETSNDVALVPGYWYTLKLSTDIAMGESSALIYREEDGVEVLFDTLTIAAIPTLDSNWALQPFVRLEKLTGSTVRTVLVDYIYWRSPATR